MKQKQNLQIPFSIFVSGLLIAGAIYFSNNPMGDPGADKSSKVSEDTQPTVKQTAPSARPSNSSTYNVSVDDDPFMGNANAPITMIEFSDFECPFCTRFSTNTLPELKRDYIETGKLKFVYRDLPLHNPGSTDAAIAAQCAFDQGKFWEYHDNIFLKFSGGNKNTTENLKSYAKDLGLDQSEFDTCFDSGKYKDEVASDDKDARAATATGTPTLFIGKTTPSGQIVAEKIVGAQPTLSFTTVIDRLLEE